jgi:hypothetical protein
MAQIVEGVNCRHLRGDQVTFSFRVECSVTQDIRYAVLEWTGTEDAVTSDVVATWAATPTWATNVAPAGSVGSTSVGTTWTDIEHTVTLGSTFTNLIVFIWSGDTVASGNGIGIEAAQLEQGAYKTPFETRPIGMELALCQRYFIGLKPSTANLRFAIFIAFSSGTAGAGVLNLPATMRVAPTLLDAAATAADVRLGGQGAPVTPTGISTFGLLGNIVTLTFTATLTGGAVYEVYLASSTRILKFDAEL